MKTSRMLLLMILGTLTLCHVVPSTWGVHLSPGKQPAEGSISEIYDLVDRLHELRWRDLEMVNRRISPLPYGQDRIDLKSEVDGACTSIDDTIPRVRNVVYHAQIAHATKCPQSTIDGYRSEVEWEEGKVAKLMERTTPRVIKSSIVGGLKERVKYQKARLVFSDKKLDRLHQLAREDHAVKMERHALERAKILAKKVSAAIANNRAHRLTDEQLEAEVIYLENSVEQAVEPLVDRLDVFDDDDDDDASSDDDDDDDAGEPLPDDGDDGDDASPPPSGAERPQPPPPRPRPLTPIELEKAKLLVADYTYQSVYRQDRKLFEIPPQYLSSFHLAMCMLWGKKDGEGATADRIDEVKAEVASLEGMASEAMKICSEDSEKKFKRITPNIQRFKDATVDEEFEKWYGGYSLVRITHARFWCGADDTLHEVQPILKKIKTEGGSPETEEPELFKSFKKAVKQKSVANLSTEDSFLMAETDFSKDSSSKK